MNKQKFEQLKNIVDQYANSVKGGYGQNWILRDLKKSTTEKDYNYIYNAIVSHIVDNPYGVLIDARYIAGRANHYAMTSGDVANVINDFRIVERLRDVKNANVK